MPERLRRWGFRGLVVVLLMLAAYYIVFGGVYSVFDMRAMRGERRDLVDRLDSLIVRTDSLAQRGDSLETDRLSIERVGREKHGLIRDGEVVVRFHQVAAEDEAQSTGKSGKNEED